MVQFESEYPIADEYRDFFFANPYTQERGSNKNLNGLVCQYIPKSFCFLTLSDERIRNKIKQQIKKAF